MSLLVFGAHPDDIEFGCGGVLAGEPGAHLVVCSLGEAASHGTPEQRQLEAEAAAGILGATLEFVDLGGDHHFQRDVAHKLRLAEVIRRVRPSVVLAPSLVANQHPDHAVLGELVRDAARLARYGGVAELRSRPAHAIGQLLFYAVTPQAEPPDISPLLIDVSAAVPIWQRAMEAHGSQTGAREYVELQLTRARLLGMSAGVGYAIALFPNDPPLLEGLAGLRRGARRF